MVSSALGTFNKPDGDDIPMELAISPVCGNIRVKLTAVVLAKDIHG